MDHANDALEPLYAHTKRPKWGLAILAWEGREKRRYQFQDGQLRTFKKGYYELLEEVDEPFERARDVVRDLKSMLRIARVRRDPKPTPKTIQRMVSFEDQVRIFEAFYPGAFEDPKWVEEVRGGPDKKRLKRHREPAIAEAREKLSAENLAEMLGKGDYKGVWEAAKDVLGSSTLTSSKDTAALRNLPDDAKQAMAEALNDLLWGEPPYEARFARWIDVLSQTPGERVTWPLATALPALVHPSEHVAVKPSVFRQQAQWMAPSLPYDSTPNAELYERLRKMSLEVARRLEKQERPARDLLDVYDFIWTTLRPKGMKKLEQLQKSS